MAARRDPVAYSTSLEGFFRPKSVAVIGASDRPESVGRTLLWNLIANPFGGVIFPVNPRRKSVLGIRAYASVLEIGQPVDLAVIATRAASVPTIIRECAQIGTKSAVVMTSFREAGKAGLGHQAEVLAIAQESGIRVIGPYSLGVMVPSTGLNATVTAGRAGAGSVGVISQSGTMCSAILDWSQRANVGFSAFVSIGNMMDVNWGDLIYWLGDDRETRCILLYMETIGDPKSFLSAAREVANHKPIVVMKGGRSGTAAGAPLPGGGFALDSDAVFDAALRRSAVLRVGAIEELFRMAEVLGRQPLPKGRRLVVVTNAGGPAALAIDSLVSGGGQLASLSEKTTGSLNKVLPGNWSQGNPVAGLGEAVAETYPKAIELLAKDPGVNGILVVLTPKPTVNPRLVAEKVRDAAKGLRVPLLASWMGGEAMTAGREVLRSSGIPCFVFPDAAARIFNYMWGYKDSLNSLYETPEPIAPWGFHENDWVRDTISELVRRAREERRVFLTGMESKKILEAYGIPVLRTVRAASVEEAVERAGDLGYPVAMEPLMRLSPAGTESRLSFLSDVSDYRADERGRGGPLNNREEVGRAYARIASEVSERFGADALGGVSIEVLPESGAYPLLLGSDVDPQFGPVLYFGAGGWLGGVYRDHAIGLPPLNTNLARKLMEQTQIFRSARENPAITPQLGELEALLIRFAQLVLDQPTIREVRIDPLVIGPKGVYAAGVHMILLEEGAPRLARPAIRPYPAEYAQRLVLQDGVEGFLRPIRPEDQPQLVAFHRRLSDQTIYNRYFGYMHVDQRTRHESLSRDCFTDYDRNLIIVLERACPDRQIVGVGRLIRMRGTSDAEFALMIEDRLQGQGLGKVLLSHLIAIGRNEGMGRLVGHVLEGNTGMIALSERMGFATRKRSGEDTIEAVLDLGGA